MTEDFHEFVFTRVDLGLEQTNTSLLDVGSANGALKVSH